MKHVPNALTLLRLVLAPVIAWLFWEGMNYGLVVPGGGLSDARAQLAADYLTAAAACFVVAAITDLFDGMIARAFNAHSKLGRIIDPIADKALVGLPLLAIVPIAAWASSFGALVVIAAAVIIIRDVTMTVIRLRSPDGEGVRVSSFAKWKTALELVVVGSFLVVGAFEAQTIAMDPPMYREIHSYLDLFPDVWLALLVITAALSAYTGWQYLRPKR